MRFLPETRFTPVLPPMAASTCANSVVGRLQEGNAAHEDSGQKAGHIGDDATAERHHHAGAVAAQTDHLFGQPFDRRQAFLIFAAGQKQYLVRNAGEALFQARALIMPHVFGGHHEDFAGGIRQIASGAFQDAALHDYVIGCGRRFHAELRHIDVVTCGAGS